MRFVVEPGVRYAIGIDLPFLFTKRDVADWARARGFERVSVRDRPARLPYDPRSAANYSDTWDTVVEATARARCELEAPGTPAWFLVLKRPKSKR
jgi:hypothetical protein